MIDYADKIRKLFIENKKPHPYYYIDNPIDLAAKVAAVRWEMHKRKRALLCEEVMAERWDLKKFVYTPSDNFVVTK